MPMLTPPLSLYVHIPWCVKKCPYCDFNSHAQRGEIPQAAYVAALLADLDRDIGDHGDALDQRPIVSMFFGGGTPSLFDPTSIGEIIDGVAARLSLADDIEITLEANPGTIEHGRFDGYRRAGINRVSIGVQSFDDAALHGLGRIHSSDDADRAVREAQAAGIDNLNIDLMYGLPGQHLAGALEDVDRAIRLGPMHLSHYQLTLEPNTQFAADPPALPDSDLSWDMQETCQRRLAEHGFAQYEVSAYARDGRSSRHNINYWTFGDYLGIGAGAHAKISDANRSSIRRRARQRTPRAYLENAGTPRAIASDTVLAPADLPFEYMMNALRLIDGVDATAFAERTGVPIAAIESTLSSARAHGWITADEHRLCTTDEGQRLLNDVIALFLPESDHDAR